MKVLICDKVSKGAIEKMKNAGLQVDDKAGITPEELLSIVENYDCIVVRSATKVKRDVIEKAKNLKLIVRGGVGVDNIDVQAAKEKGIEVMNTPKASTESVAELAIGLIFALARKIPQADRSMKEGKWEKKAFEGLEVGGKTLGIIGIGRIGQSVAKKAKDLGMKVLAWDLYIKDSPLPFVKMVSKEELLKESDFISLHIPFEKDKGPTLGEKEFEIIKEGAFIVNVARGGTVSEKALLEALKGGKIQGAAIDVFEKEPTDNMELVKHPNVICTPHIGASTKEGQARVGDEVAEIIINYSKK
ncbi:MAG: D-2-hydroxyacid dehydrogenase [Thermoanaerobaculia bacterium]